ncbi:FHA domain-containing protein [Kitasatospora sp. NPDC088391]|uniref:FHA domain-containing protein n=1 Tax=Kitasatospora sp. NPDC088391 TaxID=3364074 RepID=UPI003807DA51
MTPPPGLAIPGFPGGPDRAAGPGAPAAPPAAPPYPGAYPPAGPGSTPPSGTPTGGGYFEPRRTPTPPAGTPTGPGAPQPGGPYGAPPPPPPPPTGALANCPICRSPQTGRYCEECGYDYNLATTARPPGPAPAAGLPQGYGFPPPSPQPPAPPASAAPPAAPPAAPQAPSAFEPRRPPQSPYEPPQPPPAQPQSQSPYERPGFPPAAPGPAAPPPPPAYPSAPSFDKGPAAAFPDVDYERTGPVYAEPSAPQQQPGGEEFGTSFRLSPPGAQPGQPGQPGPGGQHGQPPAAPQRATWYAVVAADRAYFEDMMARSGPEASGLYFPPYGNERRVPLTGRGQLRIGRRSQQRGTVPEIDLSVSPEDPGASHQHALLAEQPDGSWAVVDQDSTNGTTLNGSPDALPPHTAIPLQDGDRIHVGAWTTITVHRA